MALHPNEWKNLSHVGEVKIILDWSAFQELPAHLLWPLVLTTLWEVRKAE